MKLQQGQLWQCPEAVLRIVKLDRLEVLYKAIPDLETGEGVHHRVSKKEFCRMIKTAALTTAPAPAAPPES